MQLVTCNNNSYDTLGDLLSATFACNKVAWQRRSYHCGTEAAALVVIIVNHIHTHTRALCASLQSAAVQACYTRARFVHTRMSQSGPQTKRAHQLGSFSVIHV